MSKITRIDLIFESFTAPESTNVLWLDTSVTPNILKRFRGGEWTALFLTDITKEYVDTLDLSVTNSCKSYTDTKYNAAINYTDSIIGTLKIIDIDYNLPTLDFNWDYFKELILKYSGLVLHALDRVLSNIYILRLTAATRDKTIFTFTTMYNDANNDTYIEIWTINVLNNTITKTTKKL